MLFLVIGGIGLAVLLVSLVIGEFFEVGGPLDSDVFSVASIAAFTAAFGFGAAGAQELAGNNLVAVPVGVVLGIAFAWFTVWLTRLVRGLRTDDAVNTRSLIGHEAKVLTPIPADGHGQVVLRAAGHPVTFSARSGQPIAAGARVWVSEVLSATAVAVSPIDESLPAGSAEDLPPAP